MFYDKYVNLCNKIGKSPSSVAEEIGLKRSAVTRWKKGGGVTDATIKRVADYFGVPVDYFDDDEKKPSAIEDEGPSDNDEVILSIFHSVPEELQGLLLELLQSTANILRAYPGLSLEDLKKLR